MGLPLNPMECGNSHIPPDLVVDPWTSDAESSSPPDFLLRHDLWTTFRRLMMSQITSTISTAWDLTTKSSMKTCVFTPPHETGILVAHINPYAGNHDTRLGRESSWPLAPSGTHFFQTAE